ncbi:MAG: radical SAM protein [Clostridia bacterium]|nr:radical SAM protein [Clostridia bacterium]
MSSKMSTIPFIGSYSDIRAEMNDDLQYRLRSRQATTSLGRPLYYRINVQLITTQECPFHCPFCLERQNPMTGNNNFAAQIESLKRVLSEHPEARLSITGGEPGLYPQHIANVVETYKTNGNNVFCSINTSGFSTELNGLAHINLSRNDYVSPNPEDFPNCTVQTVMEHPTLAFIKEYMNAITKVQGLLNHGDQRVTMKYLGSYQEMYDRARIAVSDFVLGKTDVNEIIAGTQYTNDDVVERLDALERILVESKGVQ